MTRWLVGGLLSSVWAGVVFNLAAIATFPTADVETFIEYQFQEFTNAEYLLDLSDASFLGLGGISAQLDLYKGKRQSKRMRRKTGNTDQPPPEHLFTIENAHFRPLILPLLTGRLMVGYDIEVGESSIEGALGQRGSTVFWTSDTEDFDLANVPLSGDGWSVDLAGQLNLLADLAHDTSDPKLSTGNIEISFEDLELAKATISGFDLMATKFSESVLKFEVADGTATVTEGRFIGDLLEIEVEGDIRLRKRFDRSRLSLTIKIKLDDSLDKFAQMTPTMKRARDSEGYYHFRGSGTVANPDFRPKSSKSRSSDRLGDNSATTSKRERTGRKRAGSDSEDRRKKRRERIRKRRERMKDKRRKRRDRGQDDDRDRDPEPTDRIDRDRDEPEDDFEEDDLPPEDVDDEPDLPPNPQQDQFDEGPDDFDEANLPGGMGYIDE
jgi:type II secretion system protein N